MIDYSNRIVHEWNFGDDKQLADRLKQLVLSGAKTATTSLWSPDKLLPNVGDHEAITDSEGRRFCIVQITNIEKKPFGEVDWGFAQKEGEGDTNLETWRATHRKFFHEWSETFTDHSFVVCEEFKLIQIISPTKKTP